MPISRFHPAVVIALALGAILAVPSALAVTFTVNSVADLPNDGTMPAGICHTSAGTCTLRAAVMQANIASSPLGVTIVVPAGVYMLTIPAIAPYGADNGDLNLAGSVPVTISGAGATTTIIDGGTNDRVFRVDAGRTATISGVAIRNGYTAGDGGGIENDGTLHLDNVAIFGNHARNGGGIVNFATLFVMNSSIGPMNVADVDGGGLSSSGPALLNISNSTVSQNVANGRGGGMLYSLPIVGFTFTNVTVAGNTAYTGGGIYNDGGLALSNSTIDGNHAANGGGIYTTGNFSLTDSMVRQNVASVDGGGIYGSGSVHLTTSSLSQNQATDKGGGLFADPAANVSMVTSTIDRNSATYGGGSHGAAILTVTDSTIKQNIAISSGGGVFSDHQIRMTRSTLNQNHSGFTAGGIYSSGSLILINDTITLNDADSYGGGVYNAGGATANVYNTSIVFNGADLDQDGGQGAGVFNDVGATFNLRNSIVAGNGVGNAPIYDECSGTLTSYGRNLFGAGHACTVAIGSGGFANLNSFNFLGPLQNNGGPTFTVALLPGSNAIDFGDPVQGCVDDNSVLITTDQRGQPRAVGFACDVGAYEYSALVPPVLVSAASRKTHGAAGTFNLPLAATPLNPTTEPRQGPAHTIVLTFDKPINAAAVTVGEGAASAGAPTFSGNNVIVGLTNVTNQQYVTITLTNVASSDGSSGGAGSVRVGFLAGDVNQNRVVSLADLGLVNAQLTQPVTASNYLKDVNANGTLTLSDKGIANGNLTKALLPP